MSAFDPAVSTRTSSNYWTRGPTFAAFPIGKWVSRGQHRLNADAVKRPLGDLDYRNERLIAHVIGFGNPAKFLEAHSKVLPF